MLVARIHTLARVAVSVLVVAAAAGVGVLIAGATSGPGSSRDDTTHVEIHYPPEVRDQFPEFEIVEELGITPSIPLAESGRLQQGSIGHGLRIEDANGEPLDEPQGFGFYVVCEYDARVDYDQDGVVSWVYATGLGTTVEAGETVRGELRVGDGNVYRDRNGDLRPGCDPEASVVEYSGSHPSAPDPREP